MRTGARRFPWVTAAVAALALLAWKAPAAWREACVFDRTAIGRGEIWRLWSGHLLHFSASHLGWNLLVVGCAGIWIEQGAFRGGRWLFGAAPLGISLALLAGDPALERYGGLSGLATALVVFACLAEWRRDGGWIWPAALAVVALKLGWELFSESSLFAHFNAEEVRAVPLSHLAGAGVAIATDRVARSFHPDHQSLTSWW